MEAVSLPLPTCLLNLASPSIRWKPYVTPEVLLRLHPFLCFYGCLKYTIIGKDYLCKSTSLKTPPLEGNF